MDKEMLEKMFSYCPKCGYHNLGIKFGQKKQNVFHYYCPCCDWKSEFIKDSGDGGSRLL